MPRFNQFSANRSYFSWLMGKKEYTLDARIKGGERHMIMSGEYDKVFPMDILPEYLIKAIIAGDIDRMEALGIYEVLMYVAPERLLEPRFLAFAREAAADGGIGVPLVAIDEAHCVSQWGQDFRPAYLQIREFIDSLPQRPIVAAFTATATERVRADIQQMLGMQNPATVVTGFDRKNLYFGCEEMGDKAKTAWVRDYVIAHSSA